VESNSDDKKVRESLYDKTREELLAQQRSNAETYDKSLLALSSGLLGISLAFIKDVVTLAHAEYKYLLFASWIGFGLTIILTIASIIYGQCKIRQLLDAAERYYLKEKEEAREESVKISNKIDRFNIWSGSVFILAIVFSISFVILNLNKEMPMGKQDNEISKKGQPTNQFQKVPPKESQPSSGKNTKTPIKRPGKE